MYVPGPQPQAASASTWTLTHQLASPDIGPPRAAGHHASLPSRVLHAQGAAAVLPLCLACTPRALGNTVTALPARTRAARARKRSRCHAPDVESTVGPDPAVSRRDHSFRFSSRHSTVTPPPSSFSVLTLLCLPSAFPLPSVESHGAWPRMPRVTSATDCSAEPRPAARFAGCPGPTTPKRQP